MRADEWTRVRPLLDRLLELPEHEHTAFLDGACDDAALRQRVLALLTGERDDASFLEPLDPPQMLDRTGERLGPWRLTRRLGEGGMGEVWFGERADGAYQKTVAIKLLQTRLGTAAQRARFERERQVLARLVHPRIARLLDGGTTEDGMPYLVMEHVDGLPVDRHCDSNALDVTARLGVFVKICEAVAAAHAQLVVHRDLKPANILVDAEGDPVLLDFGIAKVIDPAADETADITAHGSFPLTPGYASPELLDGRPVTTACDVYALGVLLYELLAGRRPHDLEGRGLVSIARLAAQPPPPPSSVAAAHNRRRLAGDLDTITARAMASEVDRRYASVQALADDIQRHLDGLPVRARPDSWTYRTGKFIRRHVLAVGAVTALLFVLCASLVTITALLLQTRRASDDARQGRLAAERRAAELHQLARSLVFDIHDSVEHLAGATSARRLLLETAVSSLDSLVPDMEDDPQALGELAAAYSRLGNLYGRPTAASLGDLQAADASHRASLALIERALILAPDDNLRRQQLEVRDTLGALLLRQGRTEEALAQFEDVNREVQALDGRGNPTTLYHLAQARLDEGHTDAALETLAQATSLARLQLEEQPNDREAQRTLAVILGKTGYAQRMTGRLDPAEAALAECLQHSEALRAKAPDDGQLLRDLAMVLGEWGSLLVDRGRLVEALTVQERQLALFARLSDDDPSNVIARRDLSLAHEKLGEGHAATGQWELALEQFSAALAVDEEVAALGLSGFADRRGVGHCHLRVSDAQAALGREEASLESARRASAILTPLASDDPRSAAVSRDLAMAHVRCGQILLDRGDAAAALTEFEALTAHITPLAERDRGHAWTQRMAMVAGYFTAATQRALGADESQDPTARRDHLDAAVTGFRATIAASADLSQRGMLQPGDEDMLPHLEAEIAACLSERGELLVP